MVCLLCSPSQSTPIEKRPVLSWGRRAHIVPIRTWIVLALPPRTSARHGFWGQNPGGRFFAENGSIFSLQDKFKKCLGWIFSIISVTTIFDTTETFVDLKKTHLIIPILPLSPVDFGELCTEEGVTHSKHERPGAEQRLRGERPLRLPTSTD